MSIKLFSQFANDALISLSMMMLLASICDRSSFARSKSAWLYRQIFLGCCGGNWTVFKFTLERIPLWSEEPNGEIIWQSVTRSGSEDSIMSMVVAVVSVTRVWPVCIKERLCGLITLQKLLSEVLGTEISMFMSPNNKKLVYKGILRLTRTDENVSKVMWGWRGSI